jgi:hypothetical protein
LYSTSKILGGVFIMALPENFPSKDLLEKEGYETVEEVSEATDEELIEIKGIAEGTLAKIREVAPYTPSDDESGTGATSDRPTGSVEPTSQSFESRTSTISKDKSDPITGQELPKGIVKNERGTLTASSTVEQNDMVSPAQIKAEHKARMRQAAERMAALVEA